MERFFLVYGGIAALLVFLVGLAFLLTDLSGMFCYYKDGNIYLVRGNKPVAEYTPQNRRRISRCMGCFVLLVDLLCGSTLLITMTRMI